MVHSRFLIRLSSLGDVILASSALEALAFSTETDPHPTDPQSNKLQSNELQSNELQSNELQSNELQSNDPQNTTSQSINSHNNNNNNFEKIDWATTKGYSELLQGHPRIHKVFEFDRQTGLQGWIEFCLQSWHRHYSEILDLHGNLRTLIMRVLFFIGDAFNRSLSLSGRLSLKRDFASTAILSLKSFGRRP